jgi:hypothetical protein
LTGEETLHVNFFAACVQHPTGGDEENRPSDHPFIHI